MAYMSIQIAVASEPEPSINGPPQAPAHRIRDGALLLLKIRYAADRINNPVSVLRKKTYRLHMNYRLAVN